MSPYRYVARLRVSGSEQDVRTVFTADAARVEQVDDTTWIVETGGDDVDTIAWYLAGIRLDFVVLEPAALKLALAALGERAASAARRL